MGETGFDPTRDRLAALRKAQDEAGGVVTKLIPEGHRCGPVAVTEEQWDALTAANELEEKRPSKTGSTSLSNSKKDYPDRMKEPGITGDILLNRDKPNDH